MRREMDDIGGAEDLADYRIGVAKEDLSAAEKNYRDGEYRTASNRSYYAIFRAVSACLALEFKSYRKYGQALGVFNKDFIRTGIFPKELGRKIKNAQMTRHESDYEDFYYVSKETAGQQLEIARAVVERIDGYISSRIEK